MTASRTPLIELEGIRRSYRSGDVVTHALRGVGLSIHAGEFVAIIGASGSGKSTLMNIIGLMDRPSDGAYRFHASVSRGPAEARRGSREGIAMVERAINDGRIINSASRPGSGTACRPVPDLQSTPAGANARKRKIKITLAVPIRFNR